MATNQNLWRQNVHISLCYVDQFKQSEYLLGFCGQIIDFLTLVCMLPYILVNLWIFFVHIIVTHYFDKKCPNFCQYCPQTRLASSQLFSCLYKWFWDLPTFTFNMQFQWWILPSMVHLSIVGSRLFYPKQNVKKYIISWN